MKHLKTLGLTALAVVALTALVGVSSASATQFHATAKTALTGEQTTNHVFEVTGQKVTCTTAKFTGTASETGTSKTQNMHPEYSSCTAFGLPANINTANCEYEFNAESNEVNLRSKDAVNAKCVGVEIDSSNIFGHCHANVPVQNAINGQSFSNMNFSENVEKPRTMTETSAATNIDVNVNTSNGVCPLTLGFHANSNYNGVTGIMGATGETFIE